MISEYEDRISKLLGIFSWILTPPGTSKVVIIGWLITSVLLNDVYASGFVWISILLILSSIQIERPWLNIVPFTPLTTIVFVLCLRWGLGGLLLQLCAPIGNKDALVKYIKEAVLLGFIPTLSIVVIGGIINYRYIQSKPLDENPIKLIATKKDFIKNIGNIMILTGIIAFSYILTGSISGTLDRGAGYMDWVGKVWRPDTIISAFIRLRDIYFLLVPLGIYILRKNRLKQLMLILSTVGILALSLTLGGRGLILYPLVILAGGLWISHANVRKLRRLIAVIVIFCILFIPIAGKVRSSKEFTGTDSKSGQLTRLGLFFEEYKGIADYLNNKTLRDLGFSLYTHSDPYLFTDETKAQAPVGAEDLDKLKYIWVPKILVENQPEINDGHLIANEIRGTPEAGLVDGRYTSFDNVSFGADLYWRFRWTGVIIGSIVFGLFYALICRLWYRFATFKGNIESTLLMCFPTTFLQGAPLRSISESAWNWFYELPKYMLMILIVGKIISIMINSKSRSKA